MQQSNKNTEIIIDGSLYEGGGQIFRMSLALSLLLKKAFTIINIRSSRPNPGINNQLMGVLELISQFGDLQIQGANFGSQTISIVPPNQLICQNNMKCGSQSAASVQLMVQCLLPILIFSKEKIELTVKGGTIVSKSPPSDSIINCLIPILRQMDINIECKVIRAGYYPKGGGLVKLFIDPIKDYIKPITLFDVLPIQNIYINFVLTRQFGIKEHVKQIEKSVIQARQMYNKSQNEESNLKMQQPNIIVHSSNIVAKKFNEVYGIIVNIFNEKNIYDCSMIANEDISLQVDNKLQYIKQIIYSRVWIDHELSQESALDEFNQDQLLIYMALANGLSQILVGKQITDHTQAALYVLKSFIPDLHAEILPQNNDSNLIKIMGIGYKN